MGIETNNEDKVLQYSELEYEIIEQREDSYVLRIDFSGYDEAQDMIMRIAEEKSISPQESVECAIGSIPLKRVREGYAQIAIDIWGHDDPEREWEVLDDPVIVIELGANVFESILELSREKELYVQEVLTHYLVYLLEDMGHHI